MKKLLTLLLTLCLVVASAFSLVACGEHEHTAKTEWSKDATHHWHACEVDGCTTQLDKAEHTYTQGVCICGAQDANYQPNNGALTKADYIEVYSKVLTEVDNYASSAQSMRATVGDTDFIEVPVNQGVNAVRGNTAMLYFLINLCNTSTFEIVDGFQDIQVIDNVSSLTDQIFKIRINMGYDEDLGVIKSTVYVEDHTSSEISISSLDFAFIYDFDSETLSGFTVLGVMGHPVGSGEGDGI